MEGEDLFEGVDLEFLAGSEAPVEASKTQKEETSVDTATIADEDGAKVETTSPDEELGFELDYIANLDEQGEVIPESGEDKNIDEGKGTPESKELSSSPYTSLTSALKEEGVLSSLSEEEMAEIKTGEDLIEAVKNQIRQNEFSDLTDDQKEYLEALRTGVPDENYRSAKSSVETYSKINEESLEGEEAENFRKAVITNDFISKGFTQEEAAKHAQRSLDLGEDVEDSKAALKRLKAGEEQKLKQLSDSARQRQEDAQKATEQRLSDLKSKIDSSNEIIPNVKFNSQTKNKVYELMTKTAGFDSNNNAMNEVVKNMVEDPEYLVKMNYLHLVTDGLTDWSKVTSAAKRSAVNKLDEALKAQDAKINTGSDNRLTDKPGTSGVIDAIRGFL